MTVLTRGTAYDTNRGIVVTDIFRYTKDIRPELQHVPPTVPYAIPIPVWKRHTK